MDQSVRGYWDRPRGRGVPYITKDEKFAKVTKVTGEKPDAEAMAKRMIGMAIKAHRIIGGLRNSEWFTVTARF